MRQRLKLKQSQHIVPVLVQILEKVPEAALASCLQRQMLQRVFGFLERQSSAISQDNTPQLGDASSLRVTVPCQRVQSMHARSQRPFAALVVFCVRLLNLFLFNIKLSLACRGLVLLSPRMQLCKRETIRRQDGEARDPLGPL